MKYKVIIFFTLLFCMRFFQVHAKTPFLHIYHIGVGQGDCTLIVFGDTTIFKTFETRAMLIDGGPSYGKAKTAVLWQYLKDTLGKYNGGILDYFVISHLHSDHMNGAPLLLDSIKTDYNMFSRLNIADRLAYKTQYNINADSCWDYNIVDQTKIIGKYLEIVTDKSVSPYHWPTALTFNRDLFYDDYFKKSAFLNIKVIPVAFNGIVDGVSYVKTKIDGKTPLSENDLSLGFIVTFNGFTYFTGGDMGGASPYSDIETPLAKWLRKTFGNDFHFCSFKVSHHGSEHSTNDTLLLFCDPTLAIIPSGLRSFNGTKLPTKSTLDNLDAKNIEIRYTFVPNNPGNRQSYYSGTVNTYQDVNIYINTPPGINGNISMTVNKFPRSTDKWVADYTSETTETVICTKTAGHINK